MEEYPKTPALENGIENRLVVTPHVTSSVPIEDVASPVELAKAYMGSRPSKVSSSMLGVQNHVLREDPTLLKCENFPPKSPIMSIVPKATRHAAVHENSFVTARSRGRSAIYIMARTPYARIYPASTLKGGGLAVEGEPSSSTQSALDQDMLSEPNKGTLKRRSSALDNGVGSFGPIRQIRHKSNLLYSKGSSLPFSGSSLSVARSGVDIYAAQQPSSSMQKPLVLDEVKRSHTKLSEENVDNTIPSMSYSPLPSKSSEMTSKILHQLDNLVSPNEKSSELRLPIVNDNSPTKLSPSMLQGQALRSMEMVDSSKLLDNVQGDKLNGTFGNLSASAQNQKLTSQRNMVENGQLKLVAPSDGLVPVKIATDATKPMNQVLSSAKSVDSFMIKSVSYPPKRNKAFHMSAHEDCLDVDDDAHPNGAFSSFSPVEKEITFSTTMAEKITSGTETIAQENSSALSVVMPSKSFTKDGEARVGTADGSRAVERVDVSTSKASFIPDPTFKPAAVTAAIQTSFGSNKPASSNGSITNPPLFNVGNKVVWSTKSTATAAPSKEITKSGSIFGMEKVVLSKEPGADAPLVNFGTNGNVFKVPPMPFTASSSVGGESASLKFGASSESKLGSSISSTTVAGATNSMAKVRESDINDTKTKTDTGFSVRASELAVSSAAPTSVSTFGHSSSQNNGYLASNPSFSSSIPSLVSNNFTSQNMFSNSCLTASCGTSVTAASTGTSMTAITPAIIALNNSSSSPSLVASSSSFSTTSFSKFGSSAAPSTGLPASSSGSEPLETKSKLDAGNGNLSSTAFSSSSAAVGSTGSGIFGSSSSTMTTVNSQSQCSVNGASSGSVLGASPFQFASQQNIAPQNPSPFQASGSHEFNAGGGSFSLGSGGGDKSNRNFL
ncbi:nuclear pore complex protein NUP1-like [Gastrolobium bilobum]|uniref:nuclear pore complex protein NUP1-like n=1 Tax=Gastrolobium bilobum TaxID=150636 RepID=UPI002AAF7CFD|nr:nuclear pore complex protein NUP1-like [Gastrolobium bilobum]